MSGSGFLSSLVLSMALVFVFAGCATDTQGESGSLSLQLVINGDTEIDEVDWTITRDSEVVKSGTINTSAPGATASVEAYGLEPGGYTIMMEAVSTDGETTCSGKAMFDIEVGEVTEVHVMMSCKPPRRFGSVRANGKFNICPVLQWADVSPLQTSVGNNIDLFAMATDEEGDPIGYMWSSGSGMIADPMAASTTYTCTAVGDDTITILVTDDGGDYCMDMHTVPVTCVAGDGDLCEGVICDDTGNECTTAACNPSTGMCETSNVTDGTDCDQGAGMCMGGTCVASPGMATVTAAHFAPEVPSAENTAVAIYVNGEEVTALGTIQYGQTTGRVPLPAPAMYDIGIGLPGGDGPLLQLNGVQLNDGDDIAATAYRTNEELPVDVFVYSLSTDGLEAGNGRVFVSHGANDPALDPVDIIVTDESACPPPLLDDFGFGTVTEALDLAATTYNLGFDLNPGDCEAEVSFSAPVTEGVTTIIVAADEDTGDGLAPQAWALVDAETVVALITPDPCQNFVCEDDGNECTDEACNPANGICETTNNTNVCEGGNGTCNAGVCVPNPECVVDGDCPATGNECIDAVCNAGTCETSNNTNACNDDTGTCNAGVCEPNAVYEQNFEALDPAASDALSNDGWLYFGNVYNSTGGFKFGFGPFAAPTTTEQISGIATGEGGPDQGAQQLVVFSNYDCCQPGEGHFGTDLVETIVFQEIASIPGNFIGQIFTFTFDAKRGNIGGNTTAQAFIKTLDPGAGFATTNNVPFDTTNLPTDWGTYSITLDLSDPALQGQILQFGFQTIASNFEGAGNFYDNNLGTLSPP